MNKKGYLISVTPLIKIPLDRDQFFYYTFDREIPTGSIVEIPLGRKTTQGVVIDSKSDFERLGNIRLKKIISVLEESFLTEKQVKLAQFVSDYYIASLGVILKTIIPSVVKARKNNSVQVITSIPEVTELTSHQEKAIEKITSDSQLSKFLLYGPASSGKTQVYFETIKKLIESDGQALIILPELTSIAQEIDRYGGHFGSKNIAVLHSKISKGAFYENWKNSKLGKKKIIIGTRQSVFAPFKNLKVIIVDEEQDISHKQWDRNPRYDARVVAEKLSEIHNAKIIFGSATPRVETFFKAQQGKINLIKIPHLKENTRNVEIISMVKERWKKNYSPISRKLEAEIEWMLKNGFQSILFINHQGMSGFSVCKSCKTTLKCPQCERALVYQKQGDFKCIHCTYKSSIFPTCSKCHGSEFKNVGTGTQKIEKEMEKTFSSARISRIDSESVSTTKTQAKVWKDFSSGKIDILIGTQMIVKNWDIPNVGLVAVIDADSLFSFPNYLTDEVAFANISQAIGRTGRYKSRIKGTALIQTFHEENQIIQSAKNMDFEKFYSEEIENRQALGYPPFQHIIKILFQDTDKDLVETETLRAYQEIKSALLGIETIRIYPPQDSLVSNIRGKHRKQIILKTKNYPDIPSNLLSILNKLPKGWAIDINPINLA